MNFTKKWFTDALERALATGGQVLATYLGADLINVLEVDWKVAFGITAGALVASFAKSLAARNFGDPQDASLVK